MTARRGAGALSLLAVLFVACVGPEPPGAPTGPTRTDAPEAEEVGAVVRRTDLRVRFVLEGVSAESAAVHVLSNPALTFVPAVRVGARVSAGDAIGRSRIAPDVLRTLEASASSSSIDASELAQLRNLQGRVLAPVEGTLTLEDDRPAVRATGIDVVAPLLPIQYLRYRSIPFSGRASIETIIGQRSVPCAALWVEVSGGEAPYELHCRIPRYVETAAGLRATITLTSKVYRDVVVVPNLYVAYDRRRDGYSVTILEDGAERRVPITVGITDGVVRVVTSELPVGATLVLPSHG